MTKRTTLNLLIAMTATLSAFATDSSAKTNVLNARLRQIDREVTTQHYRVISNEYIVVLKDGVAKSGRSSSGRGRDVREVAGELTHKFGGEVQTIWTRVFQGFLVRTSPSAARKIAAHPLVKFVEPDMLMTAPSSPSIQCNTDNYYSNQPSGNPTSPQFIDCWDPVLSCYDNWGLDRIDQRTAARNYQYTFTARGTGVHIYILDSGIANHQEFGDGNGGTRMGNGINFVADKRGVVDPTQTFDCNGHGTHVAGIAAGLRYGVAKRATIHPVRVVPCSENEERSSVVLRGIEWISANAIKPAVVNFSSNLFINPLYQSNDQLDAMEQAFESLIQHDGITVVNSAGNQNAYVGEYSPTRLADVIVVAGSNVYDERMGGDPMSGPCVDSYGARSECGSSNYGEFVDLYAPAQDVISAWYQSPTGMCRLSGTSMAAPMVTGVVAQYLQLNPTATPAQVANAIVSRATPNVIKGNFGYGTPNRLLYSGY